MMMYEVVEKMNELYKKSKKYQLRSYYVYGGGVIVVALCNYMIPSMLGVSLLFLVIGGLFCCFYIGPMVKSTMRELRTMYKESFLKGMFDEFFEDACYESWCGFSEIEVMEMGLYKLSNEFESEDKLSGMYQGVRFKQSDVHIWKYVSTEDGNDEVTYFDGRMFVFDTPMKNIGSVRIYNRISFDDRNDHRIRPDESNRVRMESMEFNDLFSVYAENAHDAFYVLTPDMMERIIRIYKKYCQKYNGDYHKMSLRFSNNKVYCALDVSSKAFDPGAFPINYPAERAKIKGDIQVIIDLIQNLDLINEEVG